MVGEVKNLSFLLVICWEVRVSQLNVSTGVGGNPRFCTVVVVLVLGSPFRCRFDLVCFCGISYCSCNIVEDEEVEIE